VTTIGVAHDNSHGVIGMVEMVGCSVACPLIMTERNSKHAVLSRGR
jgi:hypothetical protein